jgi:hypothetical protein
MPERFARFIRASAVLALYSVAACSDLQNDLFKKDEETQAIVNRRVIGMAVGDFFDTFGTAWSRAEQPDGSISYIWKSRTGPVPNGFAPLDDAVCTLRFVADKRGKIATVEVVLDDPGQTTSSRCGALFK